MFGTNLRADPDQHRSMETRTLRDLPAPDSPATDDGVEGTFCCRGCLEVTKRPDGLEESVPANLRHHPRRPPASPPHEQSKYPTTK